MSGLRTQFNAKQLNTMTLIKAVTAMIVIASVLIISVVGIAFAAQSAAEDGALGAYTSWGDNLSESALSAAEENGLTISVTMSDGQYASLFAGGFCGFDGVAVITESRHVVYDPDGLFGEYFPNAVELSKDSTVTCVVQADGVSYACALTPIGGGCLSVGYIDFTASAAALTTLHTAVISIGVFSTVLVLGAFVAYVILTGLTERGHRYKYKFTTDLEGKIISANDAFKEDFPQTLRIYDAVSNFSDDRLNAIKIPCFETEVFVACTVKRRTDGTVRISADPLAMPYNAQATQPRDMMREAYVSFLPQGKPFLMGLINFTDLNAIKSLFGLEFAENVHGILYNKIAERFTFIYDLDLYMIGVLFPNNGKPYEYLMQDLREIVDKLNEPIKIDNNIVNVTVQCGFAICDNKMAQRSFEYAMTAVDSALRRTLADPLKSYYIFHGTEIQQYAKYFFDYDIRQMLDDGMFDMEYQPQYGIAEGRIVGFEALFRVKKGANVFVNIFDLIAYAERAGYMIALGEFIFDTAMRFAKRVEDKGVTVSLNVSPVQLMQAGFCENFLEIYDRYAIRPGVLCVEITESFLVQNFEDAIKKLEILRDHGIEIHLDDFGTRYSTLLYLKKLPVQVIKIDREFVVHITEDEFDRSITEMIVDLSKRNELKTIAEGVETKEQYETLKAMGINTVQGFLIGRSAPQDEAYRLIDEFKLK